MVAPPSDAPCGAPMGAAPTAAPIREEGGGSRGAQGGLEKPEQDGDPSLRGCLCSAGTQAASMTGSALERRREMEGNELKVELELGKHGRSKAGEAEKQVVEQPPRHQPALVVAQHFTASSMLSWHCTHPMDLMHT